jgi:hypothetical protein
MARTTASASSESPMLARSALAAKCVLIPARRW